MKSARRAALSVLLKVELDGAYSNFALNDMIQKEAFADERENALTANLVYGVLERRITLDYNLSLYLKSNINKLNPTVLCILRLGAYQILFADKIPNRAAVNESVKLTAECKVKFAAGLVNAVLRKIADNGLVLPASSDLINYYSVCYSFSADIVRLLLAAFNKEDTVQILSASCGKPPLFIRVNTVKCTQSELIEELERENISVTCTDLPNCLILQTEKRLQQIKAFIEGRFYVQDYSSQAVCAFAGIRPGDKMVDCCAAPGGKSFTTAQYMNNTGSIVACDIHPHKTQLIEDGAKRLGLSCISTVCLDARQLCSHIKNADAVWCDVPCSGLGVTGRKPEIRYKALSEIEQLPPLQYEILERASFMVRSGGILIYSTCTLNPAENENVVNAFLAKHPEFLVSRDEKYRSFCGNADYMTLLPQKNGNDGFFAAKLIKES